MKLRSICKIEIKNDNVVKGIQFEGVKKICSISEAIKKATLKGAEELFLIDNTRSLFGLEPNFNMLFEAAKLSTLPITFGGGIKTLNQAMQAYSIGASRVYINSALARNHNLAIEIALRCGRQSLSGGIEYRSDGIIENECFAESGREPLGITVNERINFESKFVGEFILSSITHDGTMQGPDLDIVEAIDVRDIPLIICGGIDINRDQKSLSQKSKEKDNFSGFVSSSSFLIDQ